MIGDGFPLLSLAFVTEPLRLANRDAQRPLFSWRILSPDGNRPASSSGRRIDVDGPLDDRPADAVILLASYFADKMISSRLVDWLRRRARSGALMGCVDTGALIFAEAGLLERQPAAVHHEAIDTLRETHGEHRFSDRLYDMHLNRCSSAGGVATFDMSLALIARFGDPKLARRVAQTLNYRPLEDPRASGAFGRDWSIQRLDKTLAKSVGIMSENLETPLPICEVSRRVGLPVWKLRRLFHRHLKMSPRAYYLDLRLDRARNLLRNSNEKVRTVAMMCGFPATESLSRGYKARYGVSPSKDRLLT
ncbi:MAG: helix-turn-helix domain-containing protein [Paracoccaceae bacterium]|nr:helix-turn-helix domain-containing protein [Paracoccaceae bacterium]